ncbi:melatonin receptor type 1A [Trichechus manatus latirostris]|uniref:Melatonin receptor type 1A n=1 Tax=Trichechus manatus latirostris TaxID=127582 RepID=A0A2Y9DYL9_TRIMA|nr:melatonin receptor type 1A [Trichechus manatus latirostris]
MLARGAEPGQVSPGCGRQVRRGAPAQGRWWRAAPGRGVEGAVKCHRSAGRAARGLRDGQAGVSPGGTKRTGTLRGNDSALPSASQPAPGGEGARPRLSRLACTLACSLVVTIVVDIVGNLLVILSVYGNKKLRNAGNIFAVSLAVADLVVAVYPYPLVLTSVFNNGWKLGYLPCQISGFLMGLSAIGSIFNITGIAINRYCYICHSLKYDKLYSDENSFCCVFLIWMLTLVAIVPNLHTGTLQCDSRICSCTFAQSVNSADTVAVVVFHFVVPVIIVIFCYLRTWILVLQVGWRVKPHNKPKLQPQDFRNFVTMFVVFVLFAICWAPLNFIGLAVAFDPASMAPRIPEWLFVVSYHMAYFNSCLNAIIYGLLNLNFRKEYRRIIVSLCTPRMFFVDSSKDVADRIKRSLLR